tara:strand:+ start:476 stop:706 length:231 start_codon:yes stop_codon:yes gene_type:complete
MKVCMTGANETTYSASAMIVKMIYEKDLEVKLIADIQALLEGNKLARLSVIVRSQELCNKLKLEHNTEMELKYFPK